MQCGNVILMPKPATNQNPEGVTAVWRAVHKLEEDFQKFLAPEKKETIWSWIWTERSWFIPTAIIIISSLFGGAWYVGGLILDRHLQISFAPIRQDMSGMSGRIEGVEGRLGVLQAQIAAMKYSAIPPKELKNHLNELASAKAVLASTPRNVPNFWPTSFQIITLLSRATSEIEPMNEKENVLDNVLGPGVKLSEGIYILLKNRIRGLVFKNDVVRLDPSVQLENVTFINCVIIFPSDPNPPSNLQEIGSQLLAADLSHATIKGS